MPKITDTLTGSRHHLWLSWLQVGISGRAQCTWAQLSPNRLDHLSISDVIRGAKNWDEVKKASKCRLCHGAVVRKSGGEGLSRVQHKDSHVDAWSHLTHTAIDSFKRVPLHHCWWGHPPRVVGVMRQRVEWRLLPDSLLYVLYSYCPYTSAAHRHPCTQTSYCPSPCLVCWAAASTRRTWPRPRWGDW